MSKSVNTALFIILLFLYIIRSSFGVCTILKNIIFISAPPIQIQSQIHVCSDFILPAVTPVHLSDDLMSAKGCLADRDLDRRARMNSY